MTMAPEQILFSIGLLLWLLAWIAIFCELLYHLVRFEIYLCRKLHRMIKARRSDPIPQ